MRKFASILAAGLLVGSMAMAADAENKEETTVDTSKNPITGTETTKKVHKKKVKGAHGEMDQKVTEKTKVHKDGTVDKKVEVETESTHK